MTSTPHRQHATWITSTGGTDHLVSQQQQATAVLGRAGVFVPLCGARFNAAPMVTAPGRPCRACCAQPVQAAVAWRRAS